MIDALISGKLAATPIQHTGKKPFTTCRINTSTHTNEYLTVSVIAFDAAVCATLNALDVGDSVAISGSLTVKTWTNKKGETLPNVDMVAHALLTPYHIKRKRQAVQGQQAPTQTQKEAAMRFYSPDGLEA